MDRLADVVAPAPRRPSWLLGEPMPAVGAARRRDLGRELRRFGFDLDFAPVVDLDSGRTGNVARRPLFGVEPGQVAALAGAFLAGLHDAGVGGCLKHFPGPGPIRPPTPTSRCQRSRPPDEICAEGT